MGRRTRWLIALVVGFALTPLVAAPTSALTSRTIALSVPTSTMIGSSFTLRGVLTHSPKGSLIAIRRRSGTTWAITSYVRTYNSAGNYAKTLAAPNTRGTFYYDAYASRTASAAATVSSTRPIVVRTPVKASLTAPDPSPTDGATSSLIGSVAPWVAGTQVVLQQLASSGTSWSSILPLSPNAQGRFTAVVSPTPDVANRYRAVVSARGYYSAATSPTATITPVDRIQTTVSLASSNQQPAPDASVTLSGTITPAVSGATLTLESQTVPGPAWTTVTTTTSNGSGNYGFTVVPPASGDTRYRAVVSPQGLYLGSNSPSVTEMPTNPSSGGPTPPAPPPGTGDPAVLMSSVASTTFNDVKISFSPDPNAATVIYDDIAIVRVDLFRPAEPQVVLANLPTTARSYDDTTAQPNTTYYYMPQPREDGTIRYPYSELPVTTPAPPGSPAPLSSGTILVRNATTVVMNWTESNGTYYSGLMIRRALGPIPPEYPTDGTQVAVVSPSQTRYFDTSVSPDTQYSYSMFPIGPSGGWASPTSATVTTPRAGSGWGARQVVDPFYGDPGQLSCPTTTFCATVDPYGDAATFNGLVWTPAVRVDPGQSLRSISCPTSTRCFALDSAGNVLQMTGTTWSAPVSLQALPSNYPGSEAISCGSPTFCLAIAGGIYKYDGASWTPVSGFSASGAPSALSCLADGFCGVATSYGGFQTYDNGTWGAPGSTSAKGGIMALSCPTSTFCAAEDSWGDLVTETAGSWAPQVSGPYFPTLGSLSCSSPTRCEVAGSNVSYVNEPPQPDVVMRWDGTTWSSPVTFDASGVDESNDVSCVPLSTTCFISNYASTFGADDGTNITRLGNVDPNKGGLDPLSCVGDGVCRAVDEQGLFTQTDGQWGAHTSYPQGSYRMHTLSCPTDQWCIAIDEGGQAWTYDAGIWTGPVQIGTFTGAAEQARVSCASPTLCLATVEARFYVFDGSTWTSPSSTPYGQLESYSCSAPDFCMVIGDAGAYTFDGSTWTAAAGGSIFANSNFGSGLLSCSSPTFCVAGGQYGYQTWDGQTWTDQGYYRAANLPEGNGTNIACASSTLCVITTAHNALVYNGTSWMQYSVADDDTLSALACISSTQCEAVSGDSEYLFTQ